MRFYNVGAKGVKWKCEYKYGVYVYIRSGRKDRVFVENTHSFFVHDNAPSMDRDYHGSTPLSNRYRIAIDRERPDPHNLFIQRAGFCTRALLVHVFVVRVL